MQRNISVDRSALEQLRDQLDRATRLAEMTCDEAVEMIGRAPGKLTDATLTLGYVIGRMGMLSDNLIAVSAQINDILDNTLAPA